MRPGSRTTMWTCWRPLTLVRFWLLPGGLEAARNASPTAQVPLDAVVTQTLIPRPAKVMCIGLNYISHIEESGATPPEYPTVFAKYARALIGDGDDIMLPAISTKVDWEVELVGCDRPGRPQRGCLRSGGCDRRVQRRQ